MPGPTIPDETTHPRFRLSFLTPRYWGIWCGLLLLRSAGVLPRRWAMVVGGLLGDGLRTLNQKRRHIAEVNLSLCFPEQTPEQRRQLLVNHFRQYGRGLLDMALVLWASPTRMDKLYQLEHGARLQEIFRHKPVIVVAYHQTTLDMTGTILARHHPLVAMMKRDPNPLVNWQLWKGRTHLDKTNIKVLMRDQSLRPLVRCIQAGYLCLFSPDEDFGESKASVFAPFFGMPTSTLTVVSRLAKLTQAAVIPCATRLDPKTGNYRMTLGEPLADFPSDDALADATAVNQAMEALIRRQPDQYMWVFRWFKTQVDGKPSPYHAPSENEAA